MALARRLIKRAEPGRGGRRRACSPEDRPGLASGVNIVLSDVDCVWSADPAPMVLGRVAGFDNFKSADLVVMTDCMTPEDDLNGHG